MASMSESKHEKRKKRGYHKFLLGRSEFEVDVRYMNLKPIGRGAYGLVASADDLITGRKVAIKRISRVFADLVDAKRILREIKLLRFLRPHENIIEIQDIMTGPPDTEDFHTLYIVTALYECDLERIITSPQRLTDQHSRYFIYQVLRGLKYVHSANILHRDVKPSNLLVNSNCDLAICDFGLARGFSNKDILTDYVVTRWYRAPEILCGSETYGSAVDVWSTACIFAEVLSRKPLFRGKSSPAQLRLIIEKVGTPTEADLEDLAAPDIKATIAGFPFVPAPDFKALFPGCNEIALDLLSKMLVFNPKKRYTIQQCLDHPYLSELSKRAKEPLARSMFNTDFEKGFPDEMPQKLLQKLMYEDMLAIRGDSDKRASSTLPAIGRK